MEYRFECTSCGKCCNTPPQFTLIESINLWQEFILYLPAVCVPVDDGIAISEASRIVRRQVDHLEGLGSSMIDYHGMKVVVRFTAAGMKTDSVSRCPALMDSGLCGIYDRRPSMCRAVPFDYLVSKADQELSFRMMERNMAAQGYECRTDENAPVIWKDGALADGQYRDAYEHGISLAKAEFDLQGVMRVLMFGTDDYPNAENIEALLESVIKGEITEYAFSFVLVAAHTLSEAGYPVPFAMPDYRLVAETQTRMIDEAIAANVARKNKEDRPMTEHLRKLKKGWTGFIAGLDELATRGVHPGTHAEGSAGLGTRISVAR